MAHERDHIFDPTEPIVSESITGGSSGRLLELATTLCRRKNTVAKFTILGTLIAVIVSLLLPVRYTGTTVILPPQQGQSLANMVMGQLGALDGLGKDLGMKSPVDLYTAMLKSESVQNGLIEKFNLKALYRKKTMMDTRKELESRTTLSPMRTQGVIKVSVEDSDPRRAADLANEYVEQLHTLNQRMVLGENSQRRIFFEEQLRRTKDDLTMAEQKMKQTQERTGLLQLDAQSRGAIQTVATLKAQIAGKEVQLHAMSSFATGQNPELVIAEQQLVALREQLAKVLRNRNASGDDLEIPTSKVPEAGLAYLRAYRDLRYQEAMYEIMARQYEAARLDEAKSVNFSQVLDPATVPERKSSPKRSLIVLCAFLASFGLGCLFVLQHESYQRFVADPVNRARVDVLKQYFRSRLVK
jgi:uncharacterized protein involved in exopolysaccharide biosynthesis